MDRTKKNASSRSIVRCCANCRHANQGTEDFDDGFIFCKIDGLQKTPGQNCNIILQEKKRDLFEEFNNNSTWDKEIILI